MNTEFFFSNTGCLTMAKETSLQYYLPIAGERIIGFIPFPRILVLYEIHLVSSWILTCVAVPISYDDNHYTTGIFNIYVFIGLISLSKGISHLMGYLVPKPSLQENSSSTIYPIAGEIKRFIPFPAILVRKWT